jgi:hypothetical protein
MRHELTPAESSLRGPVRLWRRCRYPHAAGSRRGSRPSIVRPRCNTDGDVHESEGRGWRDLTSARRARSRAANAAADASRPLPRCTHRRARRGDVSGRRRLHVARSINRISRVGGWLDEGTRSRHFPPAQFGALIDVGQMLVAARKQGPAGRPAQIRSESRLTLRALPIRGEGGSDASFPAAARISRVASAWPEKFVGWNRVVSIYAGLLSSTREAAAPGALIASTASTAAMVLSRLEGLFITSTPHQMRLFRLRGQITEGQRPGEHRHLAPRSEPARRRRWITVAGGA